MQGALANWMVPMVFIKIVKTVVDFQEVETKTNTNFKGVWQPLTGQKLQIKPEGQRAWKWFTCHAEIGLTLIPDEIITYKSTNYRVMEKMDYSEYGYNEYHLVQDYEA